MTRVLMLVLWIVAVAPGALAQNTTGSMNGVTLANLVCDGVTDNASRLTAAVARAATSGNSANTVYFAPASSACMLSQSVTVPGGVHLWANPGSVTLKATTGNASTVVLLAMSGNTAGNNIYGLTFDGGGVDHTNGGNVLQVFQSSNVVFDHVKVQNTHGIGAIFSSSIVNSGFRDSVFNNVGNHWITTQLATDRQQALAFCCGTTANSHGNFSLRNTFTSIGLDAISVGSNADFLANNNICYLANGEITATWQNPQPVDFPGCVYSAASNTKFTANSNNITGAQGNAIDVISGDVVLNDNNITGSGSAGIGIFTSGSVAVSGNNVSNNAQWASSPFTGGITLSGTFTSVSLTGNVSTDNQSVKTQLYGAQVVAGSTWTELRIDPSNAFAGNKTAPVGGMIADYTVGGTKTNYILNPCFAVDQVNEGATSYAAGGGNRRIMDQWTATQSLGLGTTARTAQSSNGCVTASVLTITATKTPGAGDIYNFNQGIEGFSLQDLSYGTINAQPIVLEFQAKTSCAGTYSVALKNATGPFSYVSQYTLAANTLTPVTIVIPGDQAHAFANDNTYPLLVHWNLGSGSTVLTSTLNAWTSGTLLGATTDTVFASCANASTFSLTGVRLYPGTAHVPWVQKSQSETMNELGRYYRKSFPVGTAVAQSGGVAGAICTKNPIALGDPSVLWQWGAPMRTAPTITTYNPSAANANWRDVTAAGDATVSVDPATTLSVATGILIATSGTVATLGDILCIHATADAR